MKGNTHNEIDVVALGGCTRGSLCSRQLGWRLCSRFLYRQDPAWAEGVLHLVLRVREAIHVLSESRSANIEVGEIVIRISKGEKKEVKEYEKKRRGVKG